MIKKSTVIINKTGIHARPASHFRQAASRFQSHITIQRADGADGGEADAKNIISLLALGLSQGDAVEIKAEGADEQEAAETLVALIDSGFGE